MTHKYEQHIDVREPSGFYLGALVALTCWERDRELHILSLDTPTAELYAKPTDPVAAVVTRSLRIPLTLYTICKRLPGSVLWSERTCIMVGGLVDLHILLDGNYMVLHNRDPFIKDERDWIDDFIKRRTRMTTSEITTEDLEKAKDYLAGADRMENEGGYTPIPKFPSLAAADEALKDADEDTKDRMADEAGWAAYYEGHS